VIHSKNKFIKNEFKFFFFVYKRGTITKYIFLDKYIFNYKNISKASVYILYIFLQWIRQVSYYRFYNKYKREVVRVDYSVSNIINLI